MSKMQTVELREALRQAIDEEMERDDKVYLMGEEVAEYKRDGKKPHAIRIDHRRSRTGQQKPDVISGEQLETVGKKMVKRCQRYQDAHAQNRAGRGIANGGKR